MDNSFIIKLFLNGKDVTEQYSVINAKIYRACNKIDKATISISADIIDNSQFEILNALFHVKRCRLSSRKHQQHVDVARRDSRDSARLRDCFRIYLYQLLPSFGGKGLNGRIVKFSFNLDTLQSC